MWLTNKKDYQRRKKLFGYAKKLNFMFFYGQNNKIITKQNNKKNVAFFSTLSCAWDS